MLAPAAARRLPRHLRRLRRRRPRRAPPPTSSSGARRAASPTSLRNPKYEYARLQHRTAVPSRRRASSTTRAAWTAIVGQRAAARSLRDCMRGGHYVAERAHPRVPAPAQPGDGRHIMTLEQPRRTTSTAGTRRSISPSAASGRATSRAVISRLLAAGEGRTEREAARRPGRVRAAHLGGARDGLLARLAASRRRSPTDAPRSRSAIACTPTVLKRRLSGVRGLLHKYVEPGAVSLRRHRPRRRARSSTSSQRDRLHHDPRPHAGRKARPARRAGAADARTRCCCCADFKTKVKIFHVGFHDLVMEFVNHVARATASTAGRSTAQREPKWDLPLVDGAPDPRAAAPAVRRRRARSSASVSAPATAAARRCSCARSRLAVQESAILHFLNSLGSTAMDDFDGAGGARRRTRGCASCSSRCATTRAPRSHPEAPREVRATRNKNAASLEGSRRLSSSDWRGLTGVATRAVIGTLRPTEQRRANT